MDCPFSDAFLFDFRSGRAVVDVNPHNDGLRAPNSHVSAISSSVPSSSLSNVSTSSTSASTFAKSLSSAASSQFYRQAAVHHVVHKRFDDWCKNLQAKFNSVLTQYKNISSLETNRTYTENSRVTQLEESVRRALFSLSTASLKSTATTSRSLIMGSPDEGNRATPDDLSKPFSGVYAEDPRWIDTLTLSEYVALLAVAVTAPMAIALAIGKGIRVYQVKKYGKYCRTQAENYLLQIVQFKPKYLARLMPTIPPEDNPISKDKPHPTAYPSVFDPVSFPSYVPQQGWRTDDMALVKGAQERIKKMTDIELRMFHILMTQWSHNPGFNEVIRKNIRWAAFGECSTQDFVLGFLPAAALQDVPPQDQEVASKMHAAFRRAQVRRIIDADVYGFGSGSNAYEENPARERRKDRVSLGNFVVDMPDGTKETVDIEDVVVAPGLSSVHAKRIVDVFEAVERLRSQQRTEQGK